MWTDMIANYVIHNGHGDKCIVALAGRGGDANSVAEFYKGMREYLVIGVEPEGQEWYPRPNGPEDQKAALDGLEKARVAIEEFIEATIYTPKMPRSDIALVGFSAGAVMAIYTAVHAKSPFCCAISHSGAFLEPNDMPLCSVSTPILLTHAEDDTVFGWNSRYVPTRDALLRQKYNVSKHEKKTGGHKMLCVKEAKDFIRACF